MSDTIIVELTPPSTTTVEVHVGAPGATGYSADITKRTSAVILSGHRLVSLDGNGSLVYADKDFSASVFGMTLNSSIALEITNVQTRGEVTEPSWNWIIGQPVFLGSAGMLSQVIPTSGCVLQVATATAVNKVFIDIKIPIVLT